ncbi:MAG: pyridoxamine 5'-phosphate oxidase family protein [Leptolyngbyaceae bacterium]|nr:pyridoxamine 5'-phosphate oxidase family protein [Leptolyngbyaceae bacterium]
MQAITAAQTLLKQQSFGILSTYSVDVAGFPFGSVTPYGLTLNYHPLIYISNIAQHTKNISADNRVALTILAEAATDNPQTDPQTRPRITVIGHALPVSQDAPDSPALHQIYFNQFPDAEITLSQLGFYLYRIQPVRWRYIGGFGQIHWLEPEQLEPPEG